MPHPKDADPGDMRPDAPDPQHKHQEGQAMEDAQKGAAEEREAEGGYQ